MITDEEYKAALKVIENYHLQKVKIDTPKMLQDLDVTVRGYSILVKEFGRYFPIKNFSEVKKSHLISIRGCGVKVISDIEEALAEHDIKLLP